MSSSSISAAKPEGSFHVEQAYDDTLAACPFCEQGTLTPWITAVDHTVSGWPFQIVRCTSCNAHFTNPRPTPEAIGAYYRSENYISHTNKDRSLFARTYRAVREYAIQGKLSLIRKTHTTGDLLDVGCGTGSFLKAAAGAGYTVTGVEPSEQARTIAQDSGRIPVHPTILAIPSIPTFRIATLWHVLEHMHDPQETLRQLRERMTDHGLLIIAVPDRASWDARYYGRDWAAWDVPRHLTHFSQQDMQRILPSCGFRLRNERHMWYDAPYVSILSERSRGRGPFLSTLLGIAIGTISNIAAVIGRHPTSSTIYIAETTKRVQHPSSSLS